MGWVSDPGKTSPQLSRAKALVLHLHPQECFSVRSTLLVDYHRVLIASPLRAVVFLYAPSFGFPWVPEGPFSGCSLSEIDVDASCAARLLLCWFLYGSSSYTLVPPGPCFPYVPGLPRSIRDIRATLSIRVVSLFASRAMVFPLLAVPFPISRVSFCRALGDMLP